MKFYMVRDKATGMWYKKGQMGGTWVVQEFASVWTTPHGAVGAKANIDKHNAQACRSRLTCANWKPRNPETVALDTDRPTVGFVSCDDWQGLYINGKLVEQGHHIRIDDLLQHLGIECREIHPDDDWLVERGSLPENLEDVKQ
jgi:hypothetical protein